MGRFVRPGVNPREDGETYIGIGRTENGEGSLAVLA
jgi:hypothetical protein